MKCPTLKKRKKRALPSRIWRQRRMRKQGLCTRLTNPIFHYLSHRRNFMLIYCTACTLGLMKTCAATSSTSSERTNLKRKKRKKTTTTKIRITQMIRIMKKLKEKGKMTLETKMNKIYTKMTKAAADLIVRARTEAILMTNQVGCTKRIPIYIRRRRESLKTPSSTYPNQLPICTTLQAIFRCP
ncbi:unnamed protein product [Moneuplotes crassus]|uniref:Uncharacterized protein n=1 Tax=Euplotes crassus TaxID=5936 RepID=A0AAD1UEF9_EUPCR|nr:unnamed protein product [Moneuplotes crassus]